MSSTPASGYQSGVSPILPWKNIGTREASQPRAAIVIRGNIYTLESFSTTENAHGVLDTADAVVPGRGNPDFTQTLFQNDTDTSPILCTIYAGFPTHPSSTPNISQLTQVFVGQLDQYTITHEDNKVRFQLRSMGAGLTDRRVTTPVVNSTTLQFVQTQAALSNLSVVSNLANPPVPMSAIFNGEFISGIKNFRVFDLMTQAAVYDDVDVWVDGTTLYYVSPALVKRNDVTLEIGRDLATASITHAQQYNKKIRVEVRTWSPRTRQGTTVRYQTLADGSVELKTTTKTSTSSPIFGTTGSVTTTTSTSGGKTTTVSGSSSTTGGAFSTNTTEQTSNDGLERYPIYLPAGTSPKTANQVALSVWRRISMHEYAMTISFPIRKDLFTKISRTSLITITGSPYSKVNDQYWPRRITRTMGSDGFKMTIEMVNHQLPLGEV